MSDSYITLGLALGGLIICIYRIFWKKEKGILVGLSSALFLLIAIRALFD